MINSTILYVEKLSKNFLESFLQLMAEIKEIPTLSTPFTKLKEKT